MGWTMSLSSSRRPSASSDRTKVGLPDIEMSLPGCSLSLEISYLLGDVVPYQGRVLPLEGLLEGRRDHVLPDAVHPRGDRVLIRVLVGPERRPLLVEDAAHEHGVRGGHRRPDCISHLVVEVWEVPLLRRLHDAVQRHDLRCDHFPHRDLL